MKPQLLILLACTAACAAAGLRGVDPALRQRYVASADGQWACLDGLRTIPFSRVNDDYCDCFDGSDEPGTPACPNSHFYCRNLGHEPLRLNASMVDDGVCDCCDGSDEPAGACPNRCKQLGAEALKSLVAEVAAAEAGVRAKQKYIEEAAGLKKGWQQRLDKLEAEVAAQQAVVDAAQGKRDELQQQEHKLQDQKREAEEAERKRQQAQQAEQAAQQPAAQQAGQQEPGAAEAGDAPPAEAAPAEAQAGGAAAGAPAAEGAGAAGEVESAEDIARRVAAQWIPGAKREEGAAQPGSGSGSEGAAASGAGAEEEGEQPLGEDDGDLGPAEDEGEEDQIPEEDPILEDAGYDPAQDLATEEEDLYPGGGEEEEEGEGDQQPSPYDEEASAGASAEEPAQPAKPAQAPGAQAPVAQAPTPQVVRRMAEWASAAKAWLAAHLPEAVNQHVAKGFDWLLAHTPPQVLEWGRKLAAKLPFQLPGMAEPRPTSAVDAELDAVRRELTQARAAATREERKLRELKDEQKGLQENLGREYGAEGEFTQMVDKCFEAKVDKYTYEVCPFKKAAQKEGHSSTNLGSWGGFGEGHASMKFTGGAHCWQGPARSIEVSLHCGPAEDLTHVEEPSRCEYHAQLATPAACSAEALQALKERLAAKRALLDAPPAGRDEL